MSFHLAMDDDYDITKLINIRKVTFIEKMMIRIGFLLYVPKLVFEALFMLKQDLNPIHDGKR